MTHLLRLFCCIAIPIITLPSTLKEPTCKGTTPRSSVRTIYFTIENEFHTIHSSHLSNSHPIPIHNLIPIFDNNQSILLVQKVHRSKAHRCTSKFISACQVRCVAARPVGIHRVDEFKMSMCSFYEKSATDRFLWLKLPVGTGVVQAKSSVKSCIQLGLHLQATDIKLQQEVASIDAQVFLMHCVIRVQQRPNLGRW